MLDDCPSAHRPRLRKKRQQSLTGYEPWRRSAGEPSCRPSSALARRAGVAARGLPPLAPHPCQRFRIRHRVDISPRRTLDTPCRRKGTDPERRLHRIDGFRRAGQNSSSSRPHRFDVPTLPDELFLALGAVGPVQPHEIASVTHPVARFPLSEQRQRQASSPQRGRRTTAEIPPGSDRAWRGEKDSAL